MQVVHGKQIGGRLMGQGTYGCTFEPAPRCAGGNVFKEISGLPAIGKVTPDDVADELRIGRAIMALKDADQYFSLPTETCRPAVPLTDPDAKSCRVLVNAAKAGEDKDLSMLIMPNGGVDFYKYGADLPRLAANYKSIFIHILEGAVIYQDAGYVHNDIHHGNAVIDDHNVVRIIDFGMAFRPDDIRSWRDASLGDKFRPSYVFQPPEIHAWRALMAGGTIEQAVASLKKVNPEYRTLEAQFPKRKPAVQALEDMFRSIKMDRVSFVKKYGKQIDAWRIGLFMWLLWNDLQHWPAFRESPLYKDYHLIRKVLGGLTDFNPLVRLTIPQALSMLAA